MTRTQRNKKLNRKRTFKKIIRTIAYFVIGLVYLVYSLNTLIAKLFVKLPRFAKVVVVYSMIVLSVFGIMNFTKENQTQAKVIENEKLVVVAFEEMQEENVIVEEEQKQEEKTIAFENENETNIYNASIEKGLTHEQALLVISISRHETGNWKSNAFVNCYNFGGIMTNGATKIKCYENYEEGLNDFIRILKNYYFDLGLTTVEQIGAKYCPVGAENDPNGLNKYWVGGVSNFYENYLKNFQ